MREMLQFYTNGLWIGPDYSILLMLSTRLMVTIKTEMSSLAGYGSPLASNINLSHN